MSESKCARSACVMGTDRAYYRIWNNPGSGSGYRDYCVACGRKIIEYNRQCPNDIQLRFELIDVRRGNICINKG